uniref:Ras-specific guanine nucleotide-releasing factor 2 isoform X1 n=1 Tax=Petromyzon marinus TaxID=7757 RepID=A0AAJ7WT42_PETMA|nr:ras-specific guanine nucleotide-releasing factor 2 isoform X1 [Petromyzon marinus]
MQKGLRFNESHCLHLALRARRDACKLGYVRKRSAETSRWHLRWMALYQNLLFSFESEANARPSAVHLLEGCACERVSSPKPGGSRDLPEKQYYFTVHFGHDGQRALELCAEDEADCEAWVSAISQCNYSDMMIEREVLAQKYIHIMQIVEAEKTAANQLRQQLEDQDTEITRLKAEIVALNKTKERMQPRQLVGQEDEDPDIKKIKKVQSFLRGWLCRRKWKTIVQDYIRSPHAESMRKRNRIVFSMLEAETEYVTQLHTLVNIFLRPLRMAASSKKPTILHDDVSSIFLNSETIMFLHQIFLQGLKARLASWPTLVLADLFDILLPMLNIYQEFVRNHHYSLQVLANCKQNRDFDKLLKQYESKADCEGRTLETFLTYPMFQIPRYIITLHELLAHTPHEHVERKSLEFAKSKLEELSRVMHDEVSETENIRKSLAIERMIVEGCDILLDSSQTFVRQGSLIQVPSVERGRISRGRLVSLTLKKEGERQCFLFTKHLLICTRSSGGKLHLVKTGGVLSLIECTLIEDNETSEDESKGAIGSDMEHLDFKVAVEPKDAAAFTVVLLASSRQEKAAWTSDISQCIDNIRCNGLMMNVFEDSSKVTVPPVIKSDTTLYLDDVDIRFSKTLNSCKVPHIRYSSVEKLLERLTDLRFLSIDFLNTFLHTYRVFTTAQAVLEKLMDIYRWPLKAISPRSLELFFANSSGGRLGCNEPARSPKPLRSLPSTPLVASSPVRSRHSPLGAVPTIGSGGFQALDLSLAGAADAHGTAAGPPASVPSPAHAPSPLDLTTVGIVEEGSGDKGPVEAESLLKKSFRHAMSAGLLGRPGVELSDTAKAAESPTRSPASPRHLYCLSADISLLHLNSGGSGSGVVAASSREVDNHLRSVTAVSAFAIATAGANHGSPAHDGLAGPPTHEERLRRHSLNDQQTLDKEFAIRRAAKNRVLNVMRHWVFKHSQDFELDSKLKATVIGFLEDIMRDPELLLQERKAANNILRALMTEEADDGQLTLEKVSLTASTFCNFQNEEMKPEQFEYLSVLELAEQLTLLDFLVFRSIPYQEFLDRGWMKSDKNERAPKIMRTSKHFNEMSNLVAWEIASRMDVGARAAAIDKWVAVADICRCLHSYNTVLQITSALNRSAVYRLKKTWARVSKQTKALIDKLQKIVSSEGRFKNLRETLKSCDPPCVPYVGMYLTDLAFIEEGTPNFTEEGLVNFSKMRMISHIIREIRQFQTSCYNIEPQTRVTRFLLDRAHVCDDDSLYALSLQIEPRLPT